MGNTQYSKEFKQRVGTAAHEEGATLKSIGKLFHVPLILVKNWMLNHSTPTKPASNMTLSLAVDTMVNDDANIEALEAVLLADWETIQSECEKFGEEVDYLVEQALERLTENPASSLHMIDRIAEYWLELDNVNCSEPFEIKVRCAEFLAAFYDPSNITNDELQCLAESDIWTDRLVAGWAVRNRTDEFAIKMKHTLSLDPFEDDNGIPLVREASGYYED